MKEKVSNNMHSMDSIPSPFVDWVASSIVLTKLVQRGKKLMKYQETNVFLVFSLAAVKDPKTWIFHANTIVIRITKRRCPCIDLASLDRTQTKDPMWK